MKNIIETGEKSQIKVTRGIYKILFGILFRRVFGGRAFFFLPPGGNAGEIGFLAYIYNSLYNQALRMLSLTGCRLVCIGVSYDSLGPRYARIVRARSKLITYHYVRDNLSADCLDTIGAHYTGCVADLAFSLPFDYPRLKDHVSCAGGAIGFSFRTDKSYVNIDRIHALIQSVIAHNPGRPVRFISQVKRDTPFMQALYDQYRMLDGVSSEFVETAENLNDAIDIYRDCAFIYSNRLHALLIGLSAGAVPIAMLTTGQDNKIRGVFENALLSKNLYSLDNDVYDPTWQQETLLGAQTIAVIALQSEKITVTMDAIFGISSPENSRGLADV